MSVRLNEPFTQMLCDVIVDGNGFSIIRDELTPNILLSFDLRSGQALELSPQWPNDLAAPVFLINDFLYAFDTVDQVFIRADANNLSAGAAVIGVPHANVPLGLTGAAVDPIGGLVHLIAGSTARVIYDPINDTVVAANAISGTTGQLTAIAFDDGGQLFAANFAGRIYKVNKTSGAAVTYVSNIGFNILDMAFDPSTGTWIGGDGVQTLWASDDAAFSDVASILTAAGGPGLAVRLISQHPVPFVRRMSLGQCGDDAGLCDFTPKGEPYVTKGLVKRCDVIDRVEVINVPADNPEFLQAPGGETYVELTPTNGNDTWQNIGELTIPETGYYELDAQITSWLTVTIEKTFINNIRITNLTTAAILEGTPFVAVRDTQIIPIDYDSAYYKFFGDFTAGDVLRVEYTLYGYDAGVSGSGGVSSDASGRSYIRARRLA